MDDLQFCPDLWHRVASQTEALSSKDQLHAPSDRLKGIVRAVIYSKESILLLDKHPWGVF
jgi:hypothetical protein